MHRMKRVLTALAWTAIATSIVVSAQKPPAAAPAKPPQQAPLGPTQWRIDTAHSAAHFSVRHMMVSTVRGQLGPITGFVEYDGKDVRSIKADVTIDVKGLTTQITRRDDHLRSNDFFDVEHHPNITFKSKRIEPGADGAFKIIGDLTIRGNTKEVALAVDPLAPITKGMQGVVIGTSATTKVKRLEYGLKYNSMVEAGPVVGDEVSITIDIEANRPAPPGS
jgi:polyisoprenoid-binding protein YceI